MKLFSSGDKQGARSRTLAAHYVLAVCAAVVVVLLTEYVIELHSWAVLALVIPASVSIAALLGTGPGLVCLVLCASTLSLPAATDQGAIARRPIGAGVLATAIVLTLPAIGLLDSMKRRNLGQTRDQEPGDQLENKMAHRASKIDVARTMVPSTALELATDLQRRLDERLRAEARLAAEHSVTRILAHANSFDDAMPQILKAICANLGFELGEVWLLNAARGRLECCDAYTEQADRFADFQGRTRRAHFLNGAGLPGRVWALRTPAWVVDVAADSNFPRSGGASDAGIKSACAFPIMSGEGFFGVLEFFSTQTLEPDQDMMNAMAVVGSEIGQFILRKQAEQDLHDKHLQLQAVNAELHAIQDELRRQNQNLLTTRNELEAERQRYMELFQFAPDGYIVTDLNGAILEANHSAAIQLNAEPGSLVGENALDYIDGSEHEEVRSRMRALHDGVVSRQALEFRMMPFDAAPINAAVTLAPMKDNDGQAIGYRWLVRDIGHWRQIEGELAQHRERLEELIESRTAELESSHERLRFSERMASIGTLATGLGHDIGNFVLPVLCRLETLAEQPLPAETMQEIEQIRQSVVGLRNLSKGLSLFALDPEDAGSAPPSTAIESWWSDAGPLLRKAVPKTVELRCEFEASLPKVAIAPHQLTQAVRNLLNNAGDASGDGGVVRLWCRRSIDQRSVLLGVTDEGVGMSDEVRQHAFEPFFTTKKRSLSTGLGLSVVHAVAKSVGGSVEIESKPDHGTSVTMTLPAITDHVNESRPDLSSRGAAITLSDDRLASYAEALLKSAGIAARQTSAPANELLWITEPAESRLETVRRFLDGRTERRVMLIGQPAEEWNQPGVLVADGSHRAMHQALQNAVLDLF